MTHLKKANFVVSELYLNKSIIEKQNKNHLRGVGALAIPTWQPACSPLDRHNEL